MIGAHGGTAVLVTATAAVSPAPCTAQRIIVGVAAAGETVTLHDCATTGEATTGNRIAVVDIASRGALELGIRCRTGLVAVVSGGTPLITVVRD